MLIFETFGKASNPLLRNFYAKRFMKILENLWQSSETVQKCFPDVSMIFKNSRKIFGSVRKSLGNFGKLWKWLKSNFQMFLWFFKIFGKSSEIFGSVRKISRRNRKCS